MAEDVVAQTAEGDKKIVHTYPLVKVISKFSQRMKMKSKQREKKMPTQV